MGKKTKSRREKMGEIKERNNLRKQRKREKKLAMLEGKPKQKPKTIESMRVKDETMIGNLESEENEEIACDLKTDEFSNYFEKAYVPKVLITTSDNPLSKTRRFCKELTRIIPNSVAKYRSRMSVKKMVKAAIAQEYSDVIIVNEDQKQPNGLLLIHLPNGPTAHFRLSNVKISNELKKSHKDINEHRPEVILNNFHTRLGFTISRMLAALFHYEPEFRGRRCVTFHNQRDYIFFRDLIVGNLELIRNFIYTPGLLKGVLEFVQECQAGKLGCFVKLSPKNHFYCNLCWKMHHRYIFTKDAKARLMELGPRFTLKLRSLQLGTFDSKTGEYEWIIQGRRHEMETSRRKFFL